MLDELAETKPGNYFAPVVPLEWQLYKLNSTGLVSGITRVIESNAGTSPATSNTAMTWFGRDWRTTAYATDVSGNAVLGSLTALTEAVGAGAPMGAYLKDWKYGLPRFTYLVPLSNGHVSGLDPWHVSTGSTGAGELLFQSNSYHFGFWLDTSGYSYALRWDFGSSSLGSDWTEMLASTFAFEPSWTEVLAHDGTGVVSKGSIDALRAAVNADAPIRVATAEGHFDCQRVVASTQLACAVGDAYTPVETASNHVEYDSGRSRRLRYFMTEGRVLGEAWADHSTNLLGSVDDHTALRWFAQRDGWRLTFQTNSSGSVTLGTVDDVVAAIAHGADVAVGIAGEDYRERVRCDSLRVDTSTSGTRAACLSLVHAARKRDGAEHGPLRRACLQYQRH